MKSISSIIFKSSRKVKKIIVIGIDILLLLFTVWLSISLRYEEIRLPHIEEYIAYIAAIVIGLPIFVYSGFYKLIFRYSGFMAIKSISKACAQYGVLYFILIAIIMPKGLPRSIGIMQPILLIILLGWSRAMARFIFHPEYDKKSKNYLKERYLVYGAGSAGVQIATSLLHNSAYTVEGFIDDDESIIGQYINGIIVVGIDEVQDIVKRKFITTILIALPAAPRSRKKEIYRKLEGMGVHICTLPSIDVLTNDEVSISDIREIEIDDLLGRDSVAPYPELFSKCIKGKTVMVTGAGGSIGSELCRQIYAQHPHNIIMLEKSEYNLYSISKEIIDKKQSTNSKCDIISLLGDVTDYEFVKRVCEKYTPDTIYHTAAYKHVPLVEENPLAGIWNNVYGTLNVAKAASICKVKHMVLVSTDKAVRPTSIMGASKRIAEMVLQAMSEEKQSDICLCMVRFGNVLGSSGSVVPLFRNQIKKGGPITVTHKEVTRYFMTIPEAAQLVIQSGAMAEGGDVFLLDMGVPVRIYDLATRMIELSGLNIKNSENPDGDIEIVITGLRPGEKLYEELLISDNPIKTIHPRIYKAHEKYIKNIELVKKLEKLEQIIKKGDDSDINIKILIKEMVAGYQPEVIEKQKI